MPALPVKIASGNYDRIQALKSGEVTLEGCDVEYLNLSPPETFQRLFDHQEFDIAEMSFSTYLLARSKFDWPYTAVPVFLSRVFPHCSIYIRTDRGIERPEDLSGKKIGIPNYHFTRGLCVRGMLRDEYGVKNEDINWLTGGIDTPGGLTYMPMEPPDNINIQAIPSRESLGDMLVEGEIDGIITYRDPQVFTKKMPNIGRLFPDFRSAEQAYFSKSGIFPIMHVIGIRDDLINSHPKFAENVVAAFEAAKALAMPPLTDLDALAVTLPWLVAEAEATVDLMGEDFWPYGIEKNKKTLEAQIRWSFEQGISTGKSGGAFEIEDLFVPSCL
ncbi:MAG: ABC transporter substrate-binding protein [Rhodospirillaceae bacterium]|jgi:4,5-dihydroxyphthalate decarboxylase|nr:ABC transporter substrate-binding protein [Rhodospirillaceae bacterium]MBT4589251.1 ABC transporter substrate-binding protein [Rhodospirillaceae bacterium]MBT4937758.1 ABC transporter substrate-binding protein [Rhodospirillaceae bacterium]MBT7268271.1 ABC transporter substrate-binding protein [Rhodospirillaceae bacterium]